MAGGCQAIWPRSRALLRGSLPLGGLASIRLQSTDQQHGSYLAVGHHHMGGSGLLDRPQPDSDTAAVLAGWAVAAVCQPGPDCGCVSKRDRCAVAALFLC